MLTTHQLVTLTQRPERTVRYRLERLRRGGVVGRARPYSATGSAPARWWLTASGARLVSGTSPAPGRAAPNSLFMAHTVAIADLYVTLARLTDRSGIRVRGWVRDQDSWEEWRSHLGRRSLCPDALLQAEVDVGGEAGATEAFVEVDLGTMSQSRLRAKAARHREYVSENAWRALHPHPPLLLVLTMSEARATTFLRGLAKKALRSPWSADREDAGASVAICSAVRDPEAAMLAPVWRTSADGKRLRLVDVLGAAVRRQRRAAAHAAAEAAAEARQAPRRALDVVLGRLHPKDLDDPTAVEVVEVLRGLMHRKSRAELQAWADTQASLLLDIETWWREQQRHRYERWIPPPQCVIAALHELRHELWTIEVDRVLAAVDAGRDDDRRLPRIARELAAGRLVDGRRIGDLASTIDWVIAEQHALATYERTREMAVAEQLRRVPWYRRRRIARADVLAAWDATHLVQCVDCLVAREPQRGIDYCEICHGSLVAIRDVPSVAPLSESLPRLRQLRH